MIDQRRAWIATQGTEHDPNSIYLRYDPVVAVDECGTEAAAAAGVVIGVTSTPAIEPVTLTVDRPFVFLIRDVETGTMLFVGRLRIRPVEGFRVFGSKDVAMARQFRLGLLPGKVILARGLARIASVQLTDRAQRSTVPVETADVVR